MIQKVELNDEERKKYLSVADRFLSDANDIEPEKKEDDSDKESDTPEENDDK